MSKFSIAALPEVFVSDGTISGAVYEAARRGQLRKLGTRLYTRNLDEDPERLVRRNWYTLIASYYPDAIIADRDWYCDRGQDPARWTATAFSEARASLRQRVPISKTCGLREVVKTAHRE